MKHINYLYITLLAALMATTVGCVQDEELVFDDQPAVRMQKKIAEYKELFTSAPNGWLIDFYPEANYTRGGFAIYCKFGSDGVLETACELPTNGLATGEIDRSHWDVISYQGPTLTFDTYSKVIHFFSEASSESDRVGFSGDWDWMIVRATDDSVYFKGIKTDNYFTMTKSSGDAIEYLRSTAALASEVNIFKSFNLVLNGAEMGEATFSSELKTGQTLRTLMFAWKEGEIDTTLTVPFSYQPGTLLLKDPVTIQNVTFQRFTWDGETHTFSSPTAQLVFSGKLPLTEENLPTYEPDPDVDVVIKFNPYVDLESVSGLTAVNYQFTTMSPRIDALRTQYQTNFPQFSHYTVRFPRSSYDMSIMANYTQGGIWYWGTASGKAFQRLSTGGHNPNCEIIFKVDRLSTSSLPSGYNGSAVVGPATEFREFLGSPEGFTVFQLGENFYFRSNADPNDWIKFEPL